MTDYTGELKSLTDEFACDHLVKVIMVALSERLQFQRLIKGKYGWNTSLCNDEVLTDNAIKNIDEKSYIDAIALLSMLYMRRQGDINSSRVPDDAKRVYTTVQAVKCENIGTPEYRLLKYCGHCNFITDSFYHREPVENMYNNDSKHTCPNCKNKSFLKYIGPLLIPCKDARVLVRNDVYAEGLKRHSTGKVDSEGRLLVYTLGKTEWTSSSHVKAYKYWELG